MNAFSRSRRICTECSRVVRQERHRTKLPSAPIRCYASHAATHGTGRSRPLRMAVIGSGPAGFYTAHRVMSKVQRAKVDMFETLPVPFGLVRFGVAPDHPEVKNCQAKFEEIASSPDFTFIGNVSIGSRHGNVEAAVLELSSVLQNYDAVVFAYGAAEDKTLGIPGESSLNGIYSARQFVAWYNGLPEHAGLAPDLTRGEEAVIIGQGNVALDVARMLLEDVAVLRNSDITEHALAELSRSRIRRVRIVGRRGPMQAAFTIKEIRELMKIPGLAFNPVDTSLIPPDISKLERAPRRLMDVLLKGSKTSLADSPSKSWSLNFCLSPAEFSSLAEAPSSVALTRFNKTVLSAPFDPLSPSSKTGEQIRFPSSVVFRSIGYRSIALPGFEDAGIPFDAQRGIINNDGLGRVLRDVRSPGGAMGREPYPGLYCAGWVKRGPTGVIVSTMADAFTTADAIAHDWESQRPFLTDAHPNSAPDGWAGLSGQAIRNGGRIVHWKDWLRIDEAEKENGRPKGKEREKFTSTSDMLAVLG